MSGYDYEEPDEVKYFWNKYFESVFEYDIDDVIWYTGRDEEDYKKKIDVTVVLFNGQKNINYQVKTKYSDRYRGTVFMNIKQFDEYLAERPNIDYLGFYIKQENYGIVAVFERFMELYAEMNRYWKKLYKKGRGSQAYLTLPVEQILSNVESVPIYKKDLF